MKIAVCPTIYFESEMHLLTAIESIDTMASDKHTLDFFAFENYCKPEYFKRFRDRFKEWFVNKGNCLAASWNRAIKYGFDNGYDYVIIPNLDVLLDKGCIDKLVAFAQKHKSPKNIMFSPYCTNMRHFDKPTATYLVKPDLSSFDTYAFFMVNNGFLEMDGFDENFKPAYGEDVDMQLRMQAAGKQHWCCYEARFYHNENATIKYHSSPSRARQELTEEGGSGRYFADKWGGFPRQQKYTLPWNGFKDKEEMERCAASTLIRGYHA